MECYVSYKITVYGPIKSAFNILEGKKKGQKWLWWRGKLMGNKTKHKYRFNLWMCMFMCMFMLCA